MYAFVPNKLIVPFLTVKVMLEIFLNSYIVTFRKIIASHLLVVHTIS